MKPIVACKKKKRFPTKRAATKEAQNRGWSDTGSYYCQHCGGYHLSKKTRTPIMKLFKEIEKQREASND